MSDAPARNGSLVGRVRDLVETFVQTDLVRLRIEREGEEFEIRRPAVPGLPIPVEPSAPTPTARRNVESVRADLVGIFHFSRPTVFEGDAIEGDRELGYVEALGIRNPIRSHGAGRVVAVLVVEGEPVDYGRPLFEVDRGPHS
jgi:acetyl-CoA carboxylase biotin carboxyl carrier protein